MAEYKLAEDFVQPDGDVKFSLTINVDKNKYFKCSMYYMRRYFGLREIILLSLLLGIGLFLFLYLANIIFLVLFGVSALIILFALVLFIITSKNGSKLDYDKMGVVQQQLDFYLDGILVTNLDKNGNPIFRETHFYEKLDRIALKPKFIYIYAFTSVFYYIYPEDLSDDQRAGLVKFMREHIPADKFKFHRPTRLMPKTKRPTIG